MEAPLVVDGDVDIRTGDIDSAGDVIIKGDVRSGRAVAARGSVAVSGVVEASTITAGGDVSVECGIAGRGKGRIQANGKITIGYVNQATLEAISGLVIGSSAMNSTLLTDGDVLIEGEGVLVGGVLIAGGNLTARRVGHRGADLRDTSKDVSTRVVERTVIMLGLPPQVRRNHIEARSRLSLAEKLGRASAKNAAYIISNGVPGIDDSVSERAAFIAKAPVCEAFLLSKGPEAALDANEELRTIVASIAFSLPSPSEHREDEDSEIQNLALQLYHLYVANRFVIEVHQGNQERLSCPELNMGAALYAQDRVHEGVKITIGFQEVEIDQDMEGAVFRLADREITAQPCSAEAGEGALE